MSLVAGAVMLVLFASELSYFLSTEVQPELFVDTSRNEKMRINLDIVFPHMPCACAGFFLGRLFFSFFKPFQGSHPSAQISAWM